MCFCTVSEKQSRLKILQSMGPNIFKDLGFSIYRKGRFVEYSSQKNNIANGVQKAACVRLIVDARTVFRGHSTAAGSGTSDPGCLRFQDLKAALLIGLTLTRRFSFRKITSQQHRGHQSRTEPHTWACCRSCFYHVNGSGLRPFLFYSLATVRVY